MSLFDFRVVCAALALVPIAGSFCGAAPANEGKFRIVNRVFVGDEKEPKIRSTTIFCDGIVYDYLDEPAEVTIFDMARGRFVLLDLARRVKTELTTDQLASFTKRYREWAQAQSDPFVTFLGDPRFEERFDATNGELTLHSPWITYKLTTVEAASRPLARQYREFADWYCQLNTLVNPGARPPFARMAVNAALERRVRFPREVHLTMKPKQGPLAKRITARSEHLLVPQLVESDRLRVAQTDQFMAMFTAVAFDQYQAQVAQRDPAGSRRR